MAQTPERKCEWHEQQQARGKTRPRRHLLKIIKRCAVCGVEFRPGRQQQLTCSHICGGIWNARQHPGRHRAMHAANAAKKAAFHAHLAKALEGLTLVEAYKRGEVRGYRTAHQRFSRRFRGVA